MNLLSFFVCLLFFYFLNLFNENLASVYYLAMPKSSTTFQSLCYLRLMGYFVVLEKRKSSTVALALFLALPKLFGRANILLKK